MTQKTLSSTLAPALSPEQTVLADFSRTVSRHGSILDRLDRQHPGLLALLRGGDSLAPDPHATAHRNGEYWTIPQGLWRQVCQQFGLADPGMETHAICLHGQRILAELAAGNEIFVSDTERAARQTACTKCPWNKGGICKQARCKMSAVLEVTTKYATETCPLNRWPKRPAVPSVPCPTASSNSAPKA